MNSQVKMESDSIKLSLKRNGIGKAIITTIYLVVVYVSFTSNLINLITAFVLISSYLLLLIILDYFIAYSIIIDAGLLAILRRAHK